MWLDELQGLVDELRERINKHRNILAKSESTTRYALINPLLSEIGWRLADPDQVLTEYSIPGGRLDYAMRHDSRLCLVVEAKPLDRSLEVDDLVADKAADQAIGYCYNQGCRHFVVTNGDEWRGYDLHAPGTLQEKQQFGFDVTGNTGIMDLFWLWPGNFKSVTARPKFHGLQPQSTDNEPPNQKEPSSRLRGGTPLPQFKYEKGMPKPHQLVFPGGGTKNVRRGWAMILEATVEWLVDSEKVQSGPLRSRRGDVLLNTEPLNTKGKPFSRPKQVGSFHFEGSVGPEIALQRAVNVLEACGINPHEVRLIR